MQEEDEKTLAGLVLALGVVAALVFPSVSRLLAPLLLPALFFVMLFSLLPFAKSDIGSVVRIRPVILVLVTWQQFVLPVGFVLLAQYLELDRSIVLFGIVTLTSGSLFASPTLIQIMGLDQRTAVQSVVMSTLAVPFSIYLAFSLFSGEAIALELMPFFVRILIFLIIPISLLFIAQRFVSRWTRQRHQSVDRVGRWGAVVSLVVFCFALEDQVAMAIDERLSAVVFYVVIALSLAAIAGLTTKMVTARFGKVTSTTALVLASFRNVGLTFGLVGPVAGAELSVYVGACQIPMFLSPLFFELFFKRTATEPVAPKPADPPVAAQTGPDGNSARPAPTGFNTAAKALQSATQDVIRAPIGRQSAPVMAAGPGGASMSGALAIALPETVEEEWEERPAQRPEQPQEAEEDARALYERLRGELDKDVTTSTAAAGQGSPSRFIMAFFAVVLLLVAGMWQANKLVSPSLFDDTFINSIADAHTLGHNFAVFDLNLNIRDLRDATIAKMDDTPEVIVMGASHWQEAHVSIFDGIDFYNSHVHRDYYEDMLAVTEMWVRHGKLPPKVIITIRDNLLTPISDRTDFLWLPGIKYYRDFADRIGLEQHNVIDTLPINTWRELVSLPILWNQAYRWVRTDSRPHATDETAFNDLDTLLPGGSILWSREHQQLFTPERSREEALAFANLRKENPPVIDPKGVAHMEALFDFLVAQGVEVTLAHPPFNPYFWHAVQGTAYMDGLDRVMEQTRAWSRAYSFPIIGSFDPADVGCYDHMYIDAEHGNPTCLGRLLGRYKGAPLSSVSLRRTFKTEL